MLVVGPEVSPAAWAAGSPTATSRRAPSLPVNQQQLPGRCAVRRPPCIFELYMCLDKIATVRPAGQPPSFEFHQRSTGFFLAPKQCSLLYRPWWSLLDGQAWLLNIREVVCVVTPSLMPLIYRGASVKRRFISRRPQRLYPRHLLNLFIIYLYLLIICIRGEQDNEQDQLFMLLSTVVA